MSTPPAAPLAAAGRRLKDHLSGMWAFTGRYRILHLTWMAFFLTFVVWFNFAPLAPAVAASLGLTGGQLTTLALANVALTVPARILIGMALDRWGPRRVFAGILIYAAVPTLVFATATTFTTLLISRLAVSVIGAGFVVGIRIVAEWFPPREVGVAQGLYGGWGNFGAAAAAFTLPSLAALLGIGGQDGWRWAMALTGLLAAAYGVFYLRAVSDTPDGRDYARPRRQGALEVTHPAAVAGLVALNVPLLGILGVLSWRLERVGALGPTGLAVILAALAAGLVLQTRTILRVNRPALADSYPDHDRYPFRSVAILCLSYLVTFGSEIAVVSMLPAFFADTFGLSTVVAGAAASAYAFTNLASRPAGGILSDLTGSRPRTLRTLLLALGIGYAVMALIGPGWPVVAAMLATVACSFAVQAGEGATYAIVPLIKQRVTGQIAGLVGAYGTVGAVAYLTLLQVAGPTPFFLTIAASAVVVFLLGRWLPEPAHSFADDHPDILVLDDRQAAPTTASP